MPKKIEKGVAIKKSHFNKRKQSDTKKEYNKQRRRLKRFITQAEKRGFSFPANAIPAVPKRITKASVERLKKITPEKLYEKATYTIDMPEDYKRQLEMKGIKYEPIVKSGTEGRKIERKQAALKAKRTKEYNRMREDYYNYSDYDEGYGDYPDYGDETVSNLQDLLNEILSWSGMDVANSSTMEEMKRAIGYAQEIIKQAVNDLGKEQILQNLEGHEDEVADIVNGLQKYQNFFSGGSGITNGGIDLVKLRNLLYGAEGTLEGADYMSEFSEAGDIYN